MQYLWEPGHERKHWAEDQHWNKAYSKQYIRPGGWFWDEAFRKKWKILSGILSGSGCEQVIWSK